MRIIFSKKGISPSNGGICSPIFPDLTFCPLPVPAKSRARMKDFTYNGRSVSPMLEQLSGNPSLGRGGVYINPDIDRDAIAREPGWRPCFGQHGAPQAHLESQHVCEGDLFLFFGSFRDVLTEGGLRYRQEVPERHYIYGWLQVGAIWHPGREGEEEIPDWAANHPHVCDAASYEPNNTLYTATRILEILGMRRQLPGGGVFKFMNKERLLSDREESKPGSWLLPHWIYPASRGKPPISCHSSMERWRREGKGVVLNTTAEKNEEFVLNAEFYPEARDWLRTFFDLAEVR